MSIKMSGDALCLLLRCWRSVLWRKAPKKELRTEPSVLGRREATLQAGIGTGETEGQGTVLEYNVQR